MISSHHNEDAQRYGKHILLKEIGEEGQKRIQKSKVLVIGCGGLGNTVIPLLAGAGVGFLTIVDFDHVELSNLHRQTHFTTDHIGQRKVKILADFVGKKNASVHVKAIDKKLNSVEFLLEAQNHDLLIDCTDNFEARKMINEASVKAKRPLVFGSAIRTEGQVSFFNPQDVTSSCYACVFDGQNLPSETSAVYGVFAPLVSIIGAMQASEALKYLSGSDRNLRNVMLTYDSTDMQLYPIALKKNLHCKVCGNH